MSDYLSGRELNLKIGVSSYTESNTVLEVIGRSVLGVITATDIYSDTLQVGNFKFDKFSADNIGIAGSLTAGQLISTVTNGIGLQVNGRSVLGVTSVTDLYSDTLQVGNFKFDNFTANTISIAGTLTASRFISTVVTGTAPLSVASSTLVSNLNTQYLNGQPSSYYTNASNLNAGLVPAARLFSSNDFNVFGNIYISGSLSVGGTSVALNAQSLQIQDRDIILGITTDAFNNDISSDITADHGGIAIASTVGRSLFSLALPGISSVPDTYKQMMWVRSGAFAGLNTDAFLFNYAVGVGTNQLANGVRFAAGALNVTDTRVSSGLFVGALQGNASTATTSTNLSGGVRGSIPYQDSPGITTLLPAGQTNYILLSGGPSSPPYWATAPSAAGAFGGITIQDEGTLVGPPSSTIFLNFVGPNVRATAGTSTGTVNVTFDDYASNAGLATNVIGGIASVRTLNVTGPSTIGSVQFSGGIVTATTFVGNISGTATSAANLTGGVKGSIPYQNSAGITTFLPAGPFRYVLVSNGPTQDPYWDQVSAASGSFGGITVQDESNIVGTASSIATLNFVGPRISVSPVGSPSGIATVTLVDYVSISGYSTASGISTNVIGGIASVTSLNVTGVSTLGSVQISGGIVTATTFSGNLTGSANINSLNVTGSSTLGSVQISGGIVTATTFSGTATTANNISGGVQGSVHFQKSVGITSLLPPGQFGQILITNGSGQDPYWGPVNQAAGSFSGITVQDEGTIAAPGTASSISVLNFVGPRISVTAVSGSGVATITAVDYVSVAGIATNVIGGIASVTSLNVSGIGTNTPVLIGSGSSVVAINSSGWLGIGTITPLFPVDVVGDVRLTGNIISLNSNVGEIIRQSSGIVSTNKLDTIGLDTYSTASYRSAKYVIQISSKGSLIPGTTSISSITGGSNYFPGTYTNQNISAVGASGTQSIATLTVIPEYSLSVNSCVDGVFTSSSTLPTGLTTNQTVYYTQNLNLSQRQQSQISTFTLSNAGVGYTTTPVITVDAPIIANNPVPEVGVGSTARLSVTSMKVSNAIQTSAGFVTNIIPTITFGSPSIGVTATGQVSFGITAFNITSAGSGYTVSPSLSIAAPYNPTGLAVTVGLGISSFNWNVSGGNGYTPGEQPVVNIIGGGGSGAAIDAIGVGTSLAFTITNPGIGYTVIPTVTIVGGSGVGAGLTLNSMIVTNIIVSNPGIDVTVGLARTNDITFPAVGGVGSGAGATATTLVTSGISIINPGFGYSVSPSITYSPSNSGIATVGLGISAIQQLSTGIGYTIIPNATIIPGPSIGTTVNVSISTSLGYAGVAGTTIIAGPGYGATSVYYINVLSNRTFNISTSKGAGLTPGTGIVGYGLSVGLSTTRTGTLSIASTTLIAGGISTSGITIGTPVQNNSLITPGTTVIAIGINTITLSSPALNTGLTTTSFIFGTALIAGGKVNGVNITIPGSGYFANQSIGAAVTNFDRASAVYDSNVGSGFTFTVSSVVSNFQLSEVLTMHSVGSGSTSAFLIEAAGISDIEELGEFSSTLSAGSTTYNLNFTPNYSYNEIKFNKTLFTV
jgi:hypothetical protein